MDAANFLDAETTERTLQITPKQFVDYLNLHGRDTTCSFCKVGEYGVGPSPSGDTAALVAAPVPVQTDIGIWFFVASCLTCGHTAFFNAAMVTKRIVGKL